MKKVRVGVLFGGRSGEHEVSLRSAASVMEAIDKNKFEVVPIGITKDGRWLSAGDADNLLQGRSAPKALPEIGATLTTSDGAVVTPPEPREAELVPFQSEAAAGSRAINVDVIFPVLHGTFGEDGTIQGLLDLADLPYVGAGVLGSAAGMDKDVMKALFKAAGLPTVKHVTVLRSDWESAPAKVTKRVEAALKYPLFVKPANLGSSVGVSKAHDRKELGPAIEEAARYDRKIVIEQGVGGKKHKAREIECAVLGNDDPKVSVPGEIIPGQEFYDYAAKYLEDTSQLIIPAKVTKAETKKLQALALAAFKAVDCSGLARVDVLMDPKTRRIFLNEINTMPGFTSISMYPKLWAASGVPYSELLEQLINLGLQRHADRKRNLYSRG
jgi:D-alanine-D-alanine ligase